VNIRVSIQFLRAGVKLAGLLPSSAKAHVDHVLRESGVKVDLARLKPEDLDALLEQMDELTIDVDDGAHRVRIFCE